MAEQVWNFVIWIAQFRGGCDNPDVIPTEWYVMSGCASRKREVVEAFEPSHPYDERRLVRRLPGGVVEVVS